MDILSQTQNSCNILTSLSYEKDAYYKDASLYYKKKGTSQWILAGICEDSLEAKNWKVAINNLEPSTIYEYKIDVNNSAGDETLMAASGWIYTNIATPKAPEPEENKMVNGSMVYGITSDTIRVKQLVNARYRLKDSGGTVLAGWQESPVFTELNADTEYRVEVKIITDGTFPQSAEAGSIIRTKKECTVTLMANAGEDIVTMPDNKKVGYGNLLTEPKEAVRTGYIFTGWYIDSACTEKFDFGSTQVLANVALYAGWTENKVTDDMYIVVGRHGENGWYLSDITLRPNGGYTQIWNGINWVNEYIIGEGKDQTASFKLRKPGAGLDQWIETTLFTNSAVYNVDTTLPKVEIMADGESYSRFVNVEDFTKYKNKEITVTINAEDSVSGVAEVRYFISDKNLNKEELNNAEWKNGDSFSLTADNKYIIYARVTDNAGNYVIINSDGIIMDSTAPDLLVTYKYDGVKTDDKAAHIDVKVTDTLSDIKSVTYMIGEDGEEVKVEEKEFTIDRLEDGDYNVYLMAEDGAGNITDMQKVHVIKDTVEKEPSKEEPEDESNVWIVIAAIILIVTAAGVCIIIVMARKKKKQEEIQK